MKAAAHVANLQTRTPGMQAEAHTLGHLSRRRAGDDRPDRPILGDLAAGGA